MDAQLDGNVVVTKVNEIVAERISRTRSASCSWVSMAPSPTTTRRDSVSGRPAC